MKDFLEDFLKIKISSEKFKIQRNKPTNSHYSDPKYEVPGVPDYTIKFEDGKEIHVEFKKGTDGLRKEQMEWIYKYSMEGEECWVFWVEDKNIGY